MDRATESRVRDLYLRHGRAAYATGGGPVLPSTVAAVLGTEPFERATDRLTGTRVRDGNAVVLLPTGVHSYAKRWELIESAQRSVHLASFSVIRDDTSRRLAELVRAKVREGVEVTLIADDAALYTTRSRAILQSMADGGAEVLTYNNPFRYLAIDWARGHPIRQLSRGAKVAIKRRFHEKYLVVDGREAVLGGMNWGTKYALGGSDPSTGATPTFPSPGPLSTTSSWASWRTCSRTAPSARFAATAPWSGSTPSRPSSTPGPRPQRPPPVSPPDRRHRPVTNASATSTTSRGTSRHSR